MSGVAGLPYIQDRIGLANVFWMSPKPHDFSLRIPILGLEFEKDNKKDLKLRLLKKEQERDMNSRIDLKAGPKPAPRRQDAMEPGGYYQYQYDYYQ